MKKLLLLLCSLLATTAGAQEVVLRHTLDGGKLDALATIVLRFNDAQKGKGKVILQAASTDSEPHGRVHLGFLDVADSMAFFGTLPRFIPLHQMMKENGQTLNTAEFLPQVAHAVDDANGRLQALPLGLNFPVLFLNRAALTKAGKAANAEPHSWAELQELAGDIRTSGSTCPLTSSNFSWIHVENLAAQHGQPILPTPMNKRDAAMLRVNGLVNVKHLALLATWERSKYFVYAGAGREADARFLSGECAMLTGESSLYGEMLRRGVDAAVVPLPTYDDMSEARASDVLPDGSALWVLAGGKKPEYQLMARFVRFLMQPDVQREWVKGTTFLPMSVAGLKVLQESNNLPESQKVALIKRLSAPKKVSERLRTGSTRENLRGVFREIVQHVWSEKYPAKQALDETSQRANAAVASNPAQKGK